MCICGSVFVWGKKKYGIYYSYNASDECETCIMNEMLETTVCVCVCVCVCLCDEALFWVAGALKWMNINRVHHICQTAQHARSQQKATWLF